jgi:hypothetical protein
MNRFMMLTAVLAVALTATSNPASAQQIGTQAATIGCVACGLTVDMETGRTSDFGCREFAGGSAWCYVFDYFPEHITCHQGGDCIWNDYEEGPADILSVLDAVDRFTITETGLRFSSFSCDIALSTRVLD